MPSCHTRPKTGEPLHNAIVWLDARNQSTTKLFDQVRPAPALALSFALSQARICATVRP